MLGLRDSDANGFFLLVPLLQQGIGNLYGFCAHGD
jgi:hypothetical protein